MSTPFSLRIFVADGDLDGSRFVRGSVFASPFTTAAAVVLGRSANGRIEWKDAQGRTLKALQEQEAASG
jgi:hypothetical protein